MRVDAHSKKEYFDAVAERGPALRKLDKIIRAAAPGLKPYFAEMETMTGLCYGKYRYRYANGRESEWPVIGLAAQKNNFSLYICVSKGGKYLPEIYRDRLGKASCGKSCIRFKKIEDLDLDVIKAICAEADQLSQSNDNFRTYRSSG